MKRLISILILIIALSGAINAAVNRDSLQAALAEAQETEIFRGEILFHFPLFVVPTDTATEEYTWFPIPEMGFMFNPIVPFRGGWFAFPISLLGMFPFTDDWAALGDLSAGVEVHAPPYHAGLGYRYMRGKIYPIKGNIDAHFATADLGIPIKELGGSGIALEWLVYSKVESGVEFGTGRWNSYDGSAILLKPYWTLSPGGYGDLTLAYRFSIYENFRGYNNLGETYNVEDQGFSTLELRYVYP